MAKNGNTLEVKLGEKYELFLNILRAASPETTASQLVPVIAEQLGVTIAETSVRRQLNKIRGVESGPRGGGGPVITPKPAPAAAEKPTLAMQSVLSENKRLRDKLAKRESGWEIIREVLESVYEAPSELAVITPKRSKRGGSPEVAVCHLTDIHYGKETPTYNIEVTAQRVERYVEAVSEITDLRRAVAPIDRAKVLLGGDMIEGEGIFPHQAWETEVDIIQQMVKGGPEIIASAVISLAGIFPILELEATPGNHGRQGRFNSPRHNADSVFYEIVRKLVQISAPEAYARIKWNLPLDRVPGQQWYARFNIIGEHEGMLVHGDQIRGLLGFPWYGVGKKVAGWRTSAETRGFNYLWMGHFHTHAKFDINDATIYATGSAESTNAYALENMAAGGEPKQRLSFFNERFGELADYAIMLK